MDRKDFLKQLWKWFFKPFFYMIAAYYSFMFLVSVIFLDNSSERAFTIILLSVTIFFLAVYILGNLLTKITHKIYVPLSDKTKNMLRILKKISDYVVILLLGAMLYRFWSKDSVGALIIIAVLAANRIFIIINAGKNKVNQF